MRDKTWIFISLIISSLTILYLLIANTARNTLILSDWAVVAVDLLAKMIIESYLLFRRRSSNSK